MSFVMEYLIARSAQGCVGSYHQHAATAAKEVREVPDRTKPFSCLH